MSPLFPWMGGKRRLVPFILPLIGDPECYVEPFAGGAAIFFAKSPGTSEVLNDVNDEISNLCRVIANHTEEFLKAFKWALVGRKFFEWEQAKRPETLTDIQRAARFYYVQRNCFGGKATGQTFGTATTAAPKFNLARIEEEISEAYLRLSRAYIEHGSWQACMARYDRPHTTFYLDPPYWETEGYGVPFGFENYVEMAALARSIAGTMIISVNDHPDLRSVFAGLPMQSVPITYTVGGSGSAEPTAELVIGNWRDGWPAPTSLTAQMSMLDDRFPT